MLVTSVQRIQYCVSFTRDIVEDQTVTYKMSLTLASEWIGVYNLHLYADLEQK